MMYSPDPTPRPARITLGPSIFPNGSGWGMSLNGAGGKWRLGIVSANSSPDRSSVYSAMLLPFPIVHEPYEDNISTVASYVQP